MSWLLFCLFIYLFVLSCGYAGVNAAAAVVAKARRDDIDKEERGYLFIGVYVGWCLYFTILNTKSCLNKIGANITKKTAEKRVIDVVSNKKICLLVCWQYFVDQSCFEIDVYYQHSTVFILFILSG